MEEVLTLTLAYTTDIINALDERAEGNLDQLGLLCKGNGMLELNMANKYIDRKTNND